MRSRSRPGKCPTLGCRSDAPRQNGWCQWHRCPGTTVPVVVVMTLRNQMVSRCALGDPSMVPVSVKNRKWVRSRNPGSEFPAVRVPEPWGCQHARHLEWLPRWSCCGRGRFCRHSRMTSLEMRGCVHVPCTAHSERRILSASVHSARISSGSAGSRRPGTSRVAGSALPKEAAVQGRAAHAKLVAATCLSTHAHSGGRTGRELRERHGQDRTLGARV